MVRCANSGAKSPSGIRRGVDVDGRPLVEGIGCGQRGLWIRLTAKPDFDGVFGDTGVRRYPQTAREHDGVVVTVGYAPTAVVTVVCGRLDSAVRGRFLQRHPSRRTSRPPTSSNLSGHGLADRFDGCRIRDVSTHRERRTAVRISLGRERDI